MSDEAERRRRAAERSSRFVISREGEPAPADASTPEARLTLATALSRWAWTISGRPMPSYTRATMPIVVIRSEHS